MYVFVATSVFDGVTSAPTSAASRRLLPRLRRPITATVDSPRTARPRSRISLISGWAPRRCATLSVAFASSCTCSTQRSAGLSGVTADLREHVFIGLPRLRADPPQSERRRAPVLDDAPGLAPAHRQLGGLDAVGQWAEPGDWVGAGEQPAQLAALDGAEGQFAVGGAPQAVE